MTQRTVEDTVLRHLLTLVASEQAGPRVREIAEYNLAELRVWLEAKTDPKLPMLDTAHWSGALEQIRAFAKDPQKYAAPAALETPPGQPIGNDDEDQE